MIKFKTKKFRLLTILLFFVLILALTVRIIGISNNPPGLFSDEAANGYNAFTVWHYGEDEFGHSWPVFFKSFGDYKNPVISYSMAPIIGIFGLNEFSVRLTSVLYGTLSVIAIYLFAKEMFNSRVALLSSFFIAISPWHIHFSRVGFQLTTSMFWVPLALFLLFKSFVNFKYYPLALTSTIIAYFTYYTPRIYLPLLVLGFFLIYFNKSLRLIKKTNFWFFSILATIIFVFLIKESLADGTFFSRWSQINYSPSIKDTIIAYKNHFSFNFLFKTGDIDFPGQFITRHSVRGMGQLYLFQLPLLVFAIYKLFKESKEKKSLIFTTFWLLLYPIGSIFASINPQASRSVIGVIPFQILSAYGLIAIIAVIKKSVHKNVFIAIYSLIILVSFTHFVKLFSEYPVYAADYWGWQYGPKKIMSYFLDNKDNYTQMCIEPQFNAPEIFTKFYDPANECAGKCQVCDISKYKQGEKQLFAITSDTYNNLDNSNLPKFIERSIIYYPNGQAAFYLGEIAL